MGAVGRLTWARLRHRPAHWAILVLGVAVALALPVLSAATGRVVAARALTHAVDQLPAGERTVIASYGGTADPAQQSVDAGIVRAGIARLTSARITHQVLYGPIADTAGATFRLAATDDLAAQVRLTSGRLPGSCAPTRCEVVLVGATVPPRLDPSLGLVVVGTATAEDPLLLPGTFDPGPAAHILLGSDPDALQRLSALQQFPRGSGWVAALDTSRIVSMGVPAYAALSRSVADELSLEVRALVLSVPDDALLREDARAAASQGRFALLGGAAAVLVLGFVLVAAVGLRREHAEAAALLRRRGASRRSLVAFAGLGTAAAVAVGALAGTLIGAAAAWAMAATTSPQPPVGPLVAGALLDALPASLLLVVAAVVLTSAVLVWPSAREGTAWHVVELLAAVCLLAVALAAGRGAVTAGTSGGDPLSLVLPVLALTAGGLLAARLWVPLAAAVSRHLPARAVGARLAASGGVRRPLRTVVTVGFVTAAVGTVVFAGSYRATLAANAADTAAFDVPTDARVTIGADGVDPLTLEAAAPLPGTAWPVLRSVAGVRTSATSGDAVALLGVDPDVLPRLARWDRTVGASSGADAAALVAAPTPAAGVPIADGARTLNLGVVSWSRSAVGVVDVVAWVSTPDGRESGVPLTLTGDRLTGALPAGTGRTLTALTLRENPQDATRRQHRIGEGGTVDAVLSGRVVLAPPPGGSWDGWSSATATTSSDASGLAVAYQLTGTVVVVRPGLVGRAPVRVLVDPTTASLGTTLRLDLGGGDAVAAQVVGTLPRFPTSGPRFVVADLRALGAALDDHEPGTGAPREVWADAGGDPAVVSGLDARLAAAPWDGATVERRDERRAALESDAVAQGAASLLLVAAAVALTVALLSLVLLVAGERRDDDGVLLAQEADGVPTSTLRRSLWWRAVGAAVPGLLAGGVVGLLLTRAVSSLVALSAGGTSPVPPLEPAVGPGWTSAVLLAGLGLALLVCALVAGRMLRSAWPSRPGQELR